MVLAGRRLREPGACARRGRRAAEDRASGGRVARALPAAPAAGPPTAALRCSMPRRPLPGRPRATPMPPTRARRPPQSATGRAPSRSRRRRVGAAGQPAPVAPAGRRQLADQRRLTLATSAFARRSQRRDRGHGEVAAPTGGRAHAAGTGTHPVVAGRAHGPARGGAHRDPRLSLLASHRAQPRLSRELTRSRAAVAAANAAAAAAAAVTAVPVAASAPPATAGVGAAASAGPTAVEFLWRTAKRRSPAPRAGTTARPGRHARGRGFRGPHPGGGFHRRFACRAATAPTCPKYQHPPARQQLPRPKHPRQQAHPPGPQRQRRHLQPPPPRPQPRPRPKHLHRRARLP